MSKRQWLMIFGVIVAALPFLGFPSSWDTVIYIVVGILIIFLSYRILPDGKPQSPDAMPFVEHKNDHGQINNTFSGVK